MVKILQEKTGRRSKSSKNRWSCDLKVIGGICKRCESKCFKLRRLSTSRFMDVCYEVKHGFKGESVSGRSAC